MCNSLLQWKCGVGKRICKNGMLYFIPGTVTFKNNKKTRGSKRNTFRVLINRDGPSIYGSSHTEERNDPSLVAFVADKIAQEKGISLKKFVKPQKLF